jgi:DNA polymerase-4
VGVSFNKVFAKLGSDMKKPDATTVICREDFKELVWDLPASDMLFVGKKSASKLKLYGIKTIGDLARADRYFLKCLLGKNGLLLCDFANGHDESPVAMSEEESLPKSIGNSTTTPRDLTSEEDINIVLYRLCENVSRRMREGGFICRTVQIHVRFSDLSVRERQIKLDYPNRTAQSLFEAARSILVKRSLISEPIRSLGVRATDLMLCECEQLSFSPDIMRLQRCETVENTVDCLRDRFGERSVRRGIMLTDESLSAIALNSTELSLSD